MQSPDDAGQTNRRRKAATTRSDRELCMEAANQGPVGSDLTSSELRAGIISEGGEVTLSLLMFQCLISHSKTKINVVTLLKFLPHLQIDV